MSEVCTDAAGSCTPARFPSWAQRRFPSAEFALVAGQAAGVRLLVPVGAEGAELDLALTVPGGGGVPQAAFDLVLRDELIGRVVGGDGNSWAPAPGPGALCVLRWNGTLEVALPTLPREGDSADRELEIWLPHNASVAVRELRIWPSGGGGDSPGEPQRPRARWVHYGSSISQGVGASGPANGWPAVATRLLGGPDLLNLAVSGNCHLDPFVAGIIRGAPASLISLEVGTNIVAECSMSRRVFRPALDGFLDGVRRGRPSTPILVISPVFCEPIEETPGPLVYDKGRLWAKPRQPRLDNDLTLGEVRYITREVVERRRTEDPWLHHIDGTQLLGADQAHLLPDSLHPSDEGHQLIAHQFAALPAVREVMGS